jgi:5-(carboxyamino)imidazole ribonucleotide synthase
LRRAWTPPETLGGGQLGRMTALAAANLGYKTHIFCPEKDACAAHVASVTTFADYGNEAALDKFAKAVDVVTLEFENVPVDTVEYLAKKVPTRPSSKILQITQERVREKDFINSLGIGTAPYRAVNSAKELEAAADEIGLPAVLKSTRMGYDGKGQVKLGKKPDFAKAWKEMGSDQGILEGFIQFRMEISVIVARSVSGAIVVYPPVENRHKNHILDETIVPAPIYPHQSKKATTIARKLAQGLKLQGLLAVEMFVTKDDEILVNELAPRPHNSGHWTMDACVTSQFEQLVRAICDLPLGAVDALGPARMKNLLGDDIYKYADILSDARAKLHIYGKDEAKPGRKMGHYTKLLKS